MKRAMIAVLATLCLLAVSIGVGPAAGGVPVAANPAGAGLAASGSATSVFYEDFEGAFPGSNWLVGDMGVGSGADYWGAAWSAENARVHGGNWSGWCAEEGTNSPSMDQPNFLIRAYDYNMDAFMHQAWSSAVDMTTWDLAYLDFWAWSQTEEGADYLSLEWYDEGSGAWVNTGSGQQITGTSGWTRHYWKTPSRYMTSRALFGFLFHSDFSEIGEGVYVDDMNLMRADVTVESDSYADATAAGPGDTFTLHYHIHNPAPFAVQCGLGARIAGIDAPVGYSDAAHDTVVTIPSGYSWQTRTFTVPGGAPPEFGAPDGLYNVLFEIWSGTPKDTTDGNRFWGYAEAGDTLRVDSTPPAVPTLISPANGARIDDDTPTFDWSDVTDPSSVYYTIEVDDDAGFSSPIINVLLSTSQHTAASALTDGRYYWRVKAEDRLGNSSSPSAAWSFDVDTTPAPAVTTSAATEVGTTSATLNGALDDLGSAASVEVSFEWGLTAAYDNATAPQAMAGTGSFSADIGSLVPETTYHFRARADGEGGPVFGSDMTFTTGTMATAPPAVATVAASGIGSNSATLNLSLTSLGSAASVQVSFEWGLTAAYDNATAPQAMAGTGSFSADIGSLVPETTYHFRARADGEGGPVFGSDMTFTTGTMATAPPAVATVAASGIGSNSATLNLSLTGLGSASSVQVSFEWGPGTAYGSTTTPQTLTGTGTFSYPLSGLSPGTTYYFRAKAEGDSVSYGSDLTFTTSAAPPAPPAVTTNPATGAGMDIATLNGALTGLGSASSVRVSFEWGLTAAYGFTTPATAMAGAGNFSADLSQLAANTTYHFRAKAVGDDTAYGSDMTFITSATPTTPPGLTTADPGSVTGSSARLNGNLTSMGTATTVSVSFVWGTVQGGPYPSETAGSAQAGPGTFGFDLGGLAAGTTVYYQAKAVGDGTSYGVEKSFTTTGTTVGGPVIAGVVADHGQPGDELTVTITGSNLAGATAVAFGEGIAVSEFRVVGDTEITAKIAIDSDAAAGEREVTVTTPAGTGSSPGGFTVNDTGSRVHLWVYLVAVAGGLVGLGVLASLGVWLRRRLAKSTP